MELLMSQRERDRLKLIALLAREGVPKLLTQAQAAEQLGLTERQVRRLEVASTPGAGSTFTLYAPLLQED
jgi:DNA-binding transcriptional regulator LsrR (DeoR family)